ncbi:MAG: thiamine-phosphate kinase [Candidatus Melainabacteria bacterium]|nr:thiamine-phosphate kinase [Candidatus Melainabacteria bacterium]
MSAQKRFFTAVVADGVLLTTDTLVEGTHFLLPQIALRDLGWKSIAVNLSDVAAMAGRPRNLLVSITVPPHLDKVAFRELYEGMIECSKTYGAQIVGGDLTKGPALTIGITVQGKQHENGCLLRSGAKSGDLVIVTGDFGASRAGLWLLLNQLDSAKEFPHAISAHIHPLPRLCESWSMVRRTAGRGALMDASDGLADALSQICRSSDVGMDIDLEKLPIDAETIAIAQLAGADPVDWALYGGEDYELVGCIPESSLKDWVDDNPFHVIGVVTAADEINLKSGEKIASQLDLSKCFEQIEF